MESLSRTVWQEEKKSYFEENLLPGKKKTEQKQSELEKSLSSYR